MTFRLYRGTQGAGQDKPTRSALAGQLTTRPRCRDIKTGTADGREHCRNRPQVGRTARFGRQVVPVAPPGVARSFRSKEVHDDRSLWERARDDLDLDGGQYRHAPARAASPGIRSVSLYRPPCIALPVSPSLYRPEHGALPPCPIQVPIIMMSQNWPATTAARYWPATTSARYWPATTSARITPLTSCSGP